MLPAVLLLLLKMLKFVLPCILVLSAACTPRSEAIAPVSMTGAFSAMNCNQAATELVTERQKLTVLEANQNLAATTDALAVFLVLVPVSKITGGDKAGEVGSSKGKVIALEQRLSTCK